MRKWKPQQGSKVVFSLDGFGMAPAPAKERCEAFCKHFKLPYREYGHITLRLEDPRWPALLAALTDTPSVHQVQFKACWIEEPLPEQSDPSAWFELLSGAPEFRSPAKAPPTMHFGWRDGVYYASARFREVVQAAKLTGLEWLPRVEARADDPMPWYEVYAKLPIGRGLDHPLLDSNKYDKSQVKWKFDPARRWGQEVAWHRDFRTDVEIGHATFALLAELAPQQYFRVAGPHRFVREYLPDTSFAYTGWGYNRDKKGCGYANRPIRSICCNAAARRVLVQAGVIKASHFTPLSTVAAADADAIVFDRTIHHPLPPPVYMPEEAAAEHTRREAIVPLPALSRTTFATLEEAIAVLEARLHEGTATWTPARDEPIFGRVVGAELFHSTPESWRRIAPLLPVSAPEADGDDAEDDPHQELEFEFEMYAPAWNDWLSDDDDRDGDEKPSDRDLVIGRTMYGDWYAVRIGDPLLPSDARVVHWDHETLSIAEEWPSVAAFAAEIVDACDRAARSV